MKRKDIISLCALAILIMAGCSKVEHNPSPSPRPSEGDEWLYDVNLPVPILFGSGEVVSKSPITSVEDLADKTFGIFAVDKNAEMWTVTDGTVYLNNEGAHYDLETGSMVFGGTPEKQITLYYPSISDVNLDFYAYHPKSAATDVSDHMITTKVRFGSDDILWAPASAQDIYWNGKLFRGYNAEYIRQFPGAEYRPNFKFTHPASVIRFRITKTESAGSMDISSSTLTLKDMAKTADLCVASMGAAHVQSGTIIDDGSQRTDMTFNAATDLTNEKAILCHAFIMPEASRKIVEGKIVLNGETRSFTIDLEELGAVVEGFQAGYAYHILLTADEQLNVTVTADVNRPPQTDYDVYGDVGSEEFEDGFKIEV